MRCMHCDRTIHQHPSGVWFDSDGLTYCMQPSEGPPLSHTPMPVIRPLKD
jgi:hypothetical protein